MPGQRHISFEVQLLLDGMAFNGPIADKALDSNAFVAELNDRGAWVVISQRLARAQKLKFDAAKTPRSI